MVKIHARLCYLCYHQQGETKIAVARYFIDHEDDWFDVCGDCASGCYHDGYTVEEIEDGSNLEEL